MTAASSARPELARAAGRLEGARPHARARTRNRRRRARLLEGARGGVPDHAASALHRAQDCERARQAADHGAASRETGFAPDLDGAGPQGGGRGDHCIREKYGAKYERAVACLAKDRDTLLTFYDFPAEHWDHLRTANPIESVFATVRHRTVRTRGALSQDTARLMVFKLIMAAAKTWRRLKGECPG